MKTVITGALGHIGSRLIREWPQAFPDGEIVLLDNLSTQRYSSLFNLPKEGHYKFIEADILTCDLANLIKGADVLIHLAAITDAASSFSNPEQVEQVNFQGSRRVAQACAEAGCAMIFPSTTSVYGSQEDLVDEDCLALKPQSPYAESKLKAEEMLCWLGQESQLRFLICRFGTICGVSVGMRFHTAVNKFCWQAVMGQPLTVWSTALHQKRPYLSLQDAVQAVEFIVKNGIFENRVYNVLTANLTPQQIITFIRDHIPQVQVKLTDSKIMNQLSYEVSRSRFEKTGFHFMGSVENDIAETVAWLINAGGKNG
ncbi:MAG: SDR family oxidoreductase [Anaerolineaceae bacterium]|nr:SDR family oxidoreductase [Anaerolineaceae bacterium]